MKRSFKVAVKIKGCEIVFDKKLGPGVIAYNEVDFKPRKGRTNHTEIDIAVALHDYKQQLLEEVVEVVVTEIKDETNAEG